MKVPRRETTIAHGGKCELPLKHHGIWSGREALLYGCRNAKETNDSLESAGEYSKCFLGALTWKSGPWRNWLRTAILITKPDQAIPSYWLCVSDFPSVLDEQERLCLRRASGF
jgi:hypothetical protein